MRELLLSMKNKEFAYKCINILIDKGRQSDVEKLTASDFCKRKFDMNYPILQEVCQYGAVSDDCFIDAAHNRRYYPQPIIAFGKRYIICNDWYYNAKVNPRDTRSAFVDWILSC